MARKITTKMTLEHLEDEVRFTRSAIKADPNAVDKLEATDAWGDQIASVQTIDKEVRDTDSDVRAVRTVVNGYLDEVCRKFGDELYVAVGRNTSSTRWTRFFANSVSEFLKQAFDDQVSAVRSWLATTGDDVLEKYRKDLEYWVGEAEKVSAQEEALKARRGDLWQAREKLAEDLTEARDALQRTLAERATERDLDRKWSGQFFMKG